MLVRWLGISVCVFIFWTHGTTSADSSSAAETSMPGDPHRSLLMSRGDEICYPCLDYGAPCASSVECCVTEHMSCWRHGTPEPRCSCELGYTWLPDQLECVPIQPRPKWGALGWTTLVLTATTFLVTLGFNCYVNWVPESRLVDITATLRAGGILRSPS